jgi:hypothetical protein
MEIELKHPVQADGRSVDRLVVRRPRVRDLLAAEKAAKGNAEQEIRLFSYLCEVPPAVIEELDLADYGRLQEAYKGFLA